MIPFLKKKLSLAEQQHLMSFIEENTELVELLKKTLEVEKKQEKRLSDLSEIKRMEELKQQEISLLDKTKTSPNCVLEQEEAHRNLLVEDMLQKSNSVVGPIVKVVAHTQGSFHNIFQKFIINSLHFIMF